WGFALALLALALVRSGSGADDHGQGNAAEEAIRANNHGVALMEQFKHSQAIDEFDKVTAKAPGWAPGFANLGLACLYARETERAEPAFRQPIRLDGRLIQGPYGLAILLKGSGKTAEAIAALEAARALDPEDPDILYNLGLLQARQREFKAAV